MKKIDLPRFFSERLQGFTLPVEGVMQVFDYDEVFNLDLRTSSTSILDDDPDTFIDAHPESLGRSGSTPLHTSGTSSVLYDFAPSSDSVELHVSSHGLQHIIRFSTLSGDWFVASLSSDGQYLVVAEPYLIEVYTLSN